MNFEITLATLIATVLFMGFSFYKSRQPKKIGRPWSVPWNGMMFLCILVILLMLSHLLTLNKG